MVRNLGELGKNLQKIVSRLESNQELMKLLYFTDKDPLSREDLSQDIIQKEIYQKLLKVVPYVGETETSNSIIVIRVINGNTNYGNNEFMDIILSVEVLVPMKQWFIKDSNLRPFAIMGAIQESLRGKTINGLGKIQGGDFSLSFLTDEMSCYEMTFSITEYD